MPVTPRMSSAPLSAAANSPLKGTSLKRSVWVFIVLLVGALMGHLAVPQLITDGIDPRSKLATIIPTSFGAWRIDPNITPLTPSPDQVALIGEIYDETLSRTYVNDLGERVMLSLAYGRNQSRRFQIHKPEVCYVGQGFKLTEMRFGSMPLRGRAVPVMELVAVQGARTEPITYWIRVGDELGRGWVEQNMIRARYALRRQIPDGLLFRMSTISRGNLPNDFELQRRFARDLTAAVPDSKISALLGNVQNLKPVAP